MGMMNLSRVVLSPRLNVQSLNVYRSSGSFIAGRWTENATSPVTIPTKGIAYPSSNKELQMMPEGDRVIGAITFFTVDQLYTTRNDPSKGLSDKIEWKGEMYKILWQNPFQDYGYFMSIAERIVGD